MTTRRRTTTQLGVWRGVTWEWGAHDSAGLGLLYGLCSPDSLGGSAPRFVYLSILSAFRAVFRPQTNRLRGRQGHPGRRTSSASTLARRARGCSGRRHPATRAHDGGRVATDTRRPLIERGAAAEGAITPTTVFRSDEGPRTMSGRVGGAPSPVTDRVLRDLPLLALPRDLALGRQGLTGVRVAPISVWDPVPPDPSPHPVRRRRNRRRLLPLQSDWTRRMESHRPGRLVYPQESRVSDFLSIYARALRHRGSGRHALFRASRPRCAAGRIAYPPTLPRAEDAAGCDPRSTVARCESRRGRILRSRAQPRSAGSGRSLMQFAPRLAVRPSCRRWPRSYPTVRASVRPGGRVPAPRVVHDGVLALLAEPQCGVRAH